MKKTAVIMAGGKGERFWPKSRVNMPKQFLSLTDDGLTMIQHTVKRLLPMIAIEDIFIVTNKKYIDLVKTQLPEISKENILVEPIGKNTAPCIGFAATVINSRYDDAIMLVLPSDHLIKNNEMYIETLEKATNIASKNSNLVTIGITPTYPETGYGYIHFEKNESESEGYIVKEFVEKPDIDKAKRYLDSGQYLWNSGMFVWKVSSIMKNIEQFMPDIYEGLLKIKNTINTSNFDSVLYQCFGKFDSVSIDYGVMEKAVNIYTIPGNFGWDDVGSWRALERINKTDENDNVVNGDVIAIDTQKSVILANKKLIAVAGLNDIIVVDTDDALLICNKDNTQQVKDIIQELKKNNREDLL